MKKLIIFALCIAILGGGGYFGYSKYTKNKQAKISVDVVPVSQMATTADMYSYSSTTLSGMIVSANSQKVIVDTEKLIKKVCVEQGDTVKKGDTILEYDMTVVELELAQKENQVKVIEQAIKTDEREIAEYKTYQPSENAPVEPDEPIEPDEPDYPDEPEEPVEPDSSSDEPEEPEPEPIKTVDVVKDSFPTDSKGTLDDPYVYLCNEKTAVSKAFMGKLKSAKKFAEIWVYNENSQFMYKWIINGSILKIADIQNWSVSDGVEINTETGMITVDTQVTHCGIFSVINEQAIDITDDSSETDLDDTDSSLLDEYDEEPLDNFDDTQYDEDNTDYTDDNTYDTDSQTDSESNDYVYSRKEIASMIAEKEADIKAQQIAQKQAQLEYDDYKKKKTDGKVVAEIDGVVKKIGTASGETTDNSEEVTDEGEYDEYDTSSDSDAFAIIEGDGGVEVQFSVSELSLPKADIGATVSVMSYESGMMADAEVVSVDSEPSSYTSQNWDDNPNNSTYNVYAKLSSSDGFSVDDYVDVTLSNTTEASDSLYLPIHYVRQENGIYYIMKADENNKLVRQNIKTGAVMYGSEIEVKAGLSMSDKICFPYGTDVAEGVKTTDSDKVLYPENY